MLGKPGFLIFGNFDFVALGVGLTFVGVRFIEDDLDQDGLLSSRLRFSAHGSLSGGDNGVHVNGDQHAGSALAIAWRVVLGGAKGETRNANAFGPLHKLAAGWHEALEQIELYVIERIFIAIKANIDGADHVGTWVSPNGGCALLRRLAFATLNNNQRKTRKMRRGLLLEQVYHRP